MYLEDNLCLGACIGRFAGRISGSAFTLDNKKYSLYSQQGVHLHGGQSGFHKKYWTISHVAQGSQQSVTLTYLSPHMEEGYPGNLQVQVTYTLVNNQLHIQHKAKTDRKTIVNLTNHSYFKLDDMDEVAHYLMQINANQILETRSNLLPTRKLLSVVNTPYDFNLAKEIGAIILDTPYIINKNKKNQVEVFSTYSGIKMTVQSNQPAVVVYTPTNFAAICFETQNYPDAPNIDSFPSSELQPGETYLNEAIFTFDLVI
jgi:aldose 1-epimerase